MEVGYTQKTHSLMILTVIAAALVTATSAIVIVQQTISGTGSIKGVGMGIYWDMQCTNETSSLNWGLMEPGSSNSFTLYLRNEGDSALTLGMASENWNPANAADYMTVTWNRQGQQIDPNQVVTFVITLSVSENVQGISSFSFDITISGTS